MTKNNVTRLLETRRIPYLVFELPAEKISAIQAAALMGIPAEQVYKSIVALRQAKGKPILAIVPATSEVDLRRLAQAVGEKKIRLATERQAEDRTGLQAGGISPIALINRGFQFVIDQSAERWEQINVSGGQLGLNIRLGVKDLIELTHARVAPIAT